MDSAFPEGAPMPPVSMEQIRYVRLHWVDLSGVLRSHFMTKDDFLRLVAGVGPYVLDVDDCLVTPVSTSEPPTRMKEVWELHPGVTSLRQCGFKPHHATVMCKIANQEPNAVSSFANCPRDLLERQVQTLESNFDLGMLVNFDLQFMLLHQDGRLHEPLDRHTGHSMTTLLRGNVLRAMEEIIEALGRAGITSSGFHQETSNQVKLALDPLPPMQAVDAFMLAQDTLRTIFSQRGRKATLAPRPAIGGPHNATNMHLEFSQVSQESKVPDAILAGILDQTKALCFFGMANVDSYVRVEEGGTGHFIGFGTGNRDLPIRKTKQFRWEFRCVDVTANPYLFLGVTLRAGESGIHQQLELQHRDCPVLPQPPQFTSDEDLAEALGMFGITEKMPTSLKQAMFAAKKSYFFCSWVGIDLFARYKALKEKEIEVFATMSEEDRRKRFLYYF